MAGSRMAIEWEPDSVGVAEIDERHRQVVRRVRHLAKATAEGGAEQIRTALRSLQVTLAEHHAVEEAWMAEQGYPAAGDHARVHRSMVDRIARARSEETEATLADSAASIARVLEEHMRSDDLRLGRFYTARQNLRLLAEGGGPGMTLTPMPGAFAAVSPAPAPWPRTSAARPPGTTRPADEDQAAAPPAPRTRK